MSLTSGVLDKHLQKAQRIAIKVGSSLLIDKQTGQLNHSWFEAFIADIAQLHRLGKQILIVSSGAVALGRKVLHINPDAERPDKTKAAACAAVGQIELAHAYQHQLKDFNIPVGLVLITTHNTENRNMYLNLRDTLDMILETGAIPVLNENDAVSDYDEKYGDNDRLAARIAGMVDADLLIIFSDIDGLYTGNPRKDPEAQFIDIVPEVTPAIQAMASGTGSNVGSGGMSTKLQAAIIARSAGCNMMIANGTVLSPLTHISHTNRYTFFPAAEQTMAARKHWILGTPEPAGAVIVDDGAVKALRAGSSLLPIGCREVHGTFKRGDCIRILNKQKQEIARGLSGYSSDEVFIILGRQTKDIPKLLGHVRKPELIHRNDLVLLIS